MTLCDVCGTPVHYGERHHQCGQSAQQNAEGRVSSDTDTCKVSLSATGNGMPVVEASVHSSHATDKPVGDPAPSAPTAAGRDALVKRLLEVAYSLATLEPLAGSTIISGELKRLQAEVTAIAALSAPADTGVVVPREPTAAMVVAFNEALDGRKAWVNQIEDGLRAALITAASAKEPK